jgi:uncharacterized protein (DUF1800 family)
MTNPADLDAALALSRFGLGAREASIASIAQNPRGALKEEVTGRVLLTPAGPELRQTSDLLVDFYAFQKVLNIQRSRQAASATGAPAAPPPAMVPGSTQQNPSPPASMAPFASRSSAPQTLRQGRSRVSLQSCSRARTTSVTGNPPRN